MDSSKLLGILDEKNRKALAGGGPERVEKQHAAGKLTARERIDLLLDPGTFVEMDRFKTHRCTDFGMQDHQIPGDGVVTGHGLVHSRPAFVFAQDFTAFGGSLSIAHAEKICKVMKLAMKVGAPVIGLCDSGGARIQEGVMSLAGYADIFLLNVMASGVVPQITAIMGPTAGGAVYSPALTDWVFMIKGKSYMYITGPDVIKAVIGEEVTHDDLGGPMAHASKSGVCHFIAESDEDCIQQIQTLLGYLPDNCHEMPPVVPSTDKPDRECPELDKIIPDRATRGYDMKKVVAAVADGGVFFEPHANWAKNMFVCFIRVMGQTVGVIANNPQFGGGVLDVNASDKASRFIRFCDAFNIPLLTFADVPGYMPGTHQEWNGIISHGAKLLHAYSEATVPKFTVVTRKDYGGAYIGMCSKQLGADYVMAWPSAEIAVMGAAGACNIVYRREITTAADPEAKRAELCAAYEEQFNNPYFAAKMGIIEEVIAPRETRKRVVALLEAYKDKEQTLPEKKHNNIPL
jgi:propionyl-CoA carboxylase beta chain